MIVQEGKVLYPQSEDKKPLDRKAIERINRLSGQQIEGLEPKYIKTLTCDFDEHYARLVISKGTILIEQRRLLDAIYDSFKTLYLDYDQFGEEFMTRDFPEYFNEWDNALAFGELISSEPEFTEPAKIPIQPAASIPQLLNEEGMLKHWMSMSMNQLSAAINDVISNAQGVTEQIKGMRDGSITRLLKRVKAINEELKNCQAQCEKLEEENHRLQSWFDDWQQLRQKVANEMYDASDIAEVSGVEDPSVMADAIDAIMSGYTLQKENEELRAKQEAWRESEEYKAERRKWESETQKRIDIMELKARLLKHAETYTPTESERIRSFVLNLNEILRATAWESISTTILEEVMNVVRKNEVPPVAGDLVMTKNVSNEVNGVAQGAIGINVNKEKK